MSPDIQRTAATDDYRQDASALRRFPFLSHLGERQVACLSDLCVRRRYRKTMMLYMEGEPLDAVHFLVDGRVKLSVTSEDGKEQILAVPGPGDFFPYTSLFNGTCATSAHAITDITTLAIKPGDLTDLISREPAVAAALLAGAAQHISHLEETIRDFSLRSVPGRIARVLLEEAQRYGEPSGRGYEFPFRFTQQDLAHLVGASRETVSRTLSAFRREGAIGPGGRGRVYSDPELLSTWL